MPTTDFTETYFSSINRHQDPVKLNAGEALSIANMLPDASDLVTRPGFKGQFTTPLPGPIYLINEFRTTGATQIILASGTKLYRTVVGSATYTDITPAGISVNSAGAVGARLGKYLYVGDGVNKLLFVTSTGSGVTVSLSAPTRTLTVGLTSTTQDPTNNASLWNGHAAPSSTSELTTNGGFENDGTGTYNSSTGTYTFPNFSPTGTTLGWGVVNGMPDSRDTTHDTHFTPYAGTFSLLLDQTGDVLAQKIPASALPVLVETSYGLGSPVCRNYVFSCFLHNADTTGNSTVVVTVGARDSAGNPIGQDVTATLSESYDSLPGSWTQHEIPVNLGSIPDGVSPHHLVIYLAAGTLNRPGNSGIYVDAVSLKAKDAGFNITAAAANSLNAIERDADPVTATAVAYQWVRHGYSTATDLSKSDNIAVAISLPAGTLNTNGDKPRFRFGYTMAGVTTVYWTNTATYSDDGNYLECDTSTLIGAGTGGADPRSVATGFFIQILDDLATYEGSEVFQFGPVTAAGSLSVVQGVGYDYFYLFQEDSYNSDNDIVLSSGSPLSDAITPTPIMAEAIITLPASTGGNAPYFENPTGTVNRLSIFRFGGTLPSDVGRLVARFDPTADQSDPKGNWTWNHTTRTFTDNTADNLLTFAEFYQQYRDAWPAGISALAVNQNRLIGANGNGVYLSWLINGEGFGERGLYTSLTLAQNDPEAAIKGAFDALTSSSADPDNVQSLVPHGTTVLAIRERSVSLLHNTDPLNFAVTDFLRDSGVGCVAPKSASVVGNSVWHRAASGVMGYGISQLSGNQINPVSLRVDALIAPDTINNGGNTATVAPAAAALSFGVYHSRRFYLGCPRGGSSVCDQILVWDSRAPAPSGVGGWFQYLLPPFLPGVTSAVSLSSLVDSDTCFFGGTDGQLYLHGGTYDQATPTSPQVAIAFAFASRLYGQTPGREWWTDNIPSELYVDVLPGETTVLAQTVTGDIPAAAWTQNYTLQANVSKRIENTSVASRAKGKTLQVSFSGAGVTQFRLRAYLLNTSEGDTR